MISVIIPAYNEERTIEKCIRAVLSQKSFKEFIGEIIVIDDHSTDKTPEILRKFKRRIKIIRNKKNLGLAKSLNEGLKNSRFDYVCTLHADCIIPRMWFDEQMKHFNGKVAVVTSKIILPKDVWVKFNFWDKLFFSKFTKPLETVCANKCDIYKKSILKKIGWFSKDFRVAGEDFDLYCRMRKFGYEVKSTNMIVEHVASSHEKGAWNYFKKQLQYGEARGAILRKHHYLILFNPFAFRPFNDWRLIYALPLVIILRSFCHFIAFPKGFITGKQNW